MNAYVVADASSAPRRRAPSVSCLQYHTAGIRIALRATPHEASGATQESMWRIDE